MAPETFRRGKFAEFTKHLIWKKIALIEQLEMPELAEKEEEFK